MTNIMMVDRRGLECEPPPQSPPPIPAIGRTDNKIVAVEVEFIYKVSVRVIIESAAAVSVLGDIFQLQKNTPVSKMKTFGRPKCATVYSHKTDTQRVIAGPCTCGMQLFLYNYGLNLKVLQT